MDGRIHQSYEPGSERAEFNDFGTLNGETKPNSLSAEMTRIQKDTDDIHLQKDLVHRQQMISVLQITTMLMQAKHW